MNLNLNLSRRARFVPVDRAFVLRAVAANGDALHSCAPRLQRDQEVALLALRSTGFDVLYYRAAEAHPATATSDRDAVLAAVTQKAAALQYASQALQV